MRARLIAVAGLLASVSMVACSGSFEPGDELGLWALRSFNGSSVPGEVVLFEPVDTVPAYVTYERFELNSGGDCRYSFSVRIDKYDYAGEEAVDDCEYQVDFEAETIDIRLFGGEWTSGSIEGSTMTLRWEVPGDPETANVGVYRKQ